MSENSGKLQIEYENYLMENPSSTYSYEEWFNNVWEPFFSDFSFDWDDEDFLSDWDNTLLDGLDEEG
jgi:hypothetical protein